MGAARQVTGISRKVRPHPFNLVVVRHSTATWFRRTWMCYMVRWIFHSDLFFKIRKTTLRANPETNVNKFMCVHIYITHVYYKVNP